jgi:hypothetical protein
VLAQIAIAGKNTTQMLVSEDQVGITALFQKNAVKQIEWGRGVVRYRIIIRHLCCGEMSIYFQGG